MNAITVNRRDFTRSAKQLRRSGIVPGSVFGGPLPDSISLQLDEATARRLIRSKREGSKLQLSLDGQILPVQLKEKNVNPLNSEILHISFQALKPDQKVNSVIHIILKNTEKITETLERMLVEIPYAALPGDMIDTITIDVDGMPVDSVITVGDIPELKSGKIDLQIDTEEIVLRISSKKHASEKAAAQEEA